MASLLRPLLPSDLDALVQLENLCFLTDHLGRRSFQHLIQAPTAQSWGAFAPQSELLQGYILTLTRKNSSWWRIYSLAVAPTYRGQGISRLLLQHTLQQAHQAQAAGIRLEVSVNNLTAYQLYLGLGFEVVDVLPCYYADGQDGYRMQLSF